jgi:hypothetical protein
VIHRLTTRRRQRRSQRDRRILCWRGIGLEQTRRDSDRESRGTPVASEITLSVPDTYYPKGGVYARGSTVPLDDVDDSPSRREDAQRQAFGPPTTFRSFRRAWFRPTSMAFRLREIVTPRVGTSLPISPRRPCSTSGERSLNNDVTRPREYWMPSCAMSGQGTHGARHQCGARWHG